jgi:dTMP kinase
VAGTFITFEGGEGTGKTTQVEVLRRRIEASGATVLATREPGGTPEAEAVRALLVRGEVGRWTAQAEALLNYAARDSHLEKIVRPALAGGTIVLCDRFMDSTRAYQGHAGGCDMALLDQLEEAIVGATRPHLTLIFDLDPELGLERAGQRAAVGSEDRYERKGLDFHRRLRAGFLDILRRNPRRCRLIDAARPVAAVAEDVWSKVQDAL